ncbi:alkylmercury lyase family protein [Nocardia ninae]|nr:alkylmercury lyase family protein [Nocardia ninae]
MRLEILQVPDCPNVAVLEDRIRQASAGEPVQIAHRVIDDSDQAAAAGMTGSPTLLIDGHDPFPTTGQLPSLSCRLYSHEDGRLDGAPSVAALREALSLPVAAGSCDSDQPTPCCSSAADRGPVDTLDTWRGAARPADPAEKAVHQAILRSFVAHGVPPTLGALTEVLTGHSASVAEVLRRLHDGDVLRLDVEGSAIVSAYPFSTAPTPHRAQIAGGATVYTMCAIDALGLAAMLDTDVYITSADPVTGAPITVSIEAEHLLVHPVTTVVFVGGTASRGPSADTCCSYLNFFTDRSGAHAWAAGHPEIGGAVMDLAEAHELGSRIFASLLRD